MVVGLNESYSIVVVITEEASHVDIFFLLLLLFNNGSGNGLGGRGTSGSWGVLGSVEHGLSLVELETSGEGKSNEVLESGQESVWGRASGWAANTKRKTGLSGDTASELGEDGSIIKIEDSWVEHAAVLENFLDLHLVLEWIDLELIKELSLSSSNLVTLGDDLLGLNDFNLSLDNLGLDLQVLEERCLLWVKSSWTGWNRHIKWGNHTILGWGWSDLLIKNCLDFTEVTVGENEVGVSPELTNDLFDVWVRLPVLLSLFVISITLLWSGVDLGEASLHEGVLSHDHVSSDRSELLSEV